MYCPKCGAEYRAGYTSCSDCHVFLVNEPPAGRLRVGESWGAGSAAVGDGGNEEPHDWGEPQHYAGETPAEPGDANRDPFCSFWKGQDLRICTEICAVLDEAGIPQRTIRRQDHLFNFNNQVPYEVGVPASLYHKAELAIKEAFGTDQEGEQAVPLLPGPDGEGADFSELRQEAIAEANEWLGPRYPDDATVEVWSGEDEETKNMIEMSLRESDVVLRSEKHAEGARVFVVPEDEVRAKEIVREIIEGQPLE